MHRGQTPPPPSYYLWGAPPLVLEQACNFFLSLECTCISCPTLRLDSTTQQPRGPPLAKYLYDYACRPLLEIFPLLPSLLSPSFPPSLPLSLPPPPIPPLLPPFPPSIPPPLPSPSFLYQNNNCYFWVCAVYMAAQNIYIYTYIYYPAPCILSTYLSKGVQLQRSFKQAK